MEIQKAIGITKRPSGAYVNPWLSYRLLMVYWETHVDQLEGDNNLGILLVALREEFRALKPADDYVVAPLSIPNFTPMSKPIPTVTATGES